MIPSAVDEHYSFSRTVGRGNGGTTFSTEGEGKITAVRLWEHNNAYIAGSVLPLPCPFVSRVRTYEGGEGSHIPLGCEILSVSRFAFVLCPSCSIQLRYGYIWSTRVGGTVGSPIEMELFDDEHIIQVSGVSGASV